MNMLSLSQHLLNCIFRFFVNITRVSHTPSAACMRSVCVTYAVQKQHRLIVLSHRTRLQCVCGPCVLRMRCTSSTDSLCFHTGHVCSVYAVRVCYVCGAEAPQTHCAFTQDTFTVCMRSVCVTYAVHKQHRLIVLSHRTRLQRVCGPCVLRMRCRSTTDSLCFHTGHVCSPLLIHGCLPQTQHLSKSKPC